MTYKHGDWYCKPANEAEAREIVDRAMKSGAINSYTWKGSATRFQYGVVNGRVEYGELNGTEYTIEELRKKFPLPDEKAIKWNGEGLPPVGTVCEHWWGGVYDDDVEIVQYRRNGNHVVFWRINKDCVDGAEIPTAEFRPLRSEREQWIDDAINVVGGKQAVISAENVFGKIYDAIKSGQLIMPEEDHELR